ncbi:MAG: hypothetical protein LBB14_00910 [Puniceicoccales bacterium]|jgi:hypothetical protein|nr:hypothetical protein [Puniceicoccales bacterium]
MAVPMSFYGANVGDFRMDFNRPLYVDHFPGEAMELRMAEEGKLMDKFN